jgi:hypothetical protein
MFQTKETWQHVIVRTYKDGFDNVYIITYIKDDPICSNKSDLVTVALTILSNLELTRLPFLL